MKGLNVCLVLVLAATVGAHLFVDPGPDVPNRDFLPGMAYSAAAESYAATPLLRSGRVLQAPPAGTIARDATHVSYAPTPADALRAGEELAAPPQAGPDAVRGAAVYATFCVVCHDGTGTGQGPVVARGFPAPPSLLAARARQMKDGQLFHVVTYGQNNMPAYAAQIDEADRWRVVAHVRRLQGSAK